MTRLLAALLLLAATAPASAQIWHQIQVVVFQNPGAAGSSEVLATAPDRAIEYPANLVEIPDVPAEGDAPPADGFQSTEITDKEFSAALANLQRSSQYRVLAVKSWRQPALGREEAVAVRLTGGDKYGAYYRVDGSVRLITSQTLHFETNLWLGDYAAQPSDSVSSSISSSMPAPGAPQFSASVDLDEPQPTSANAATEAEYVATRLVHVQDSRAMNSGELHYLDHPVLGVLVKVVRLKNVE